MTTQPTIAGAPDKAKTVRDGDQVRGADRAMENVAAWQPVVRFFDVLIADAEARELGYLDAADRVWCERKRAAA